MEKIQIALNGNTTREIAIAGVKELMEKHPDAEFYSCILDKEATIAKGLDTIVVDALTEAFGDKIHLVSLDSEYKELDTTARRVKLASECDVLALVGYQIRPGVVEEINLYSTKPIEIYNGGAITISSNKYKEFIARA